MSEPRSYGITVFCDDIRAELGNKPSFMGCYPQAMVVIDFPAVIPKFGFGVICYKLNRKSGVYPKSAELRIFLPTDTDTPSISSKTLIPLPPSPFNHSENPDEPIYMTANLNLVCSPLVINAPGNVKVRVLFDDGELVKCGSLRVEQAVIQAP